MTLRDVTPCSRFAVLAIAGGLLAVADAGGTGWGAGLDFTLEGSAGRTDGGRRGTAVQGLLLGRVQWNRAADDSASWDWSAYGSVLAHAGHGPTGRWLGDFLGASNMEAYSSPRLYAWWGEARHRGWTLRAGALLADEEFATTEAGGNFLNSAFGWPAFVSANTVNTGPAFFVPALGVRLERTWAGRGAWRIGLYDGDTFDAPHGDPRVNRHGVRFRAGPDQGWFAITEAVLAPAEWPVRFKSGVWLHTAAAGDLREGAGGGPLVVTGETRRVHSSNQGAYLAVERTVTAGVEVFLRGGIAPGDRNPLAWSLDAGLSWTGLVPRRPADVAFVGVVHAGFSSHYADAARAADPTTPAPDFEQVFEAGYTVAINDRWSLQPDVQYLRHPGGSGRRDALVFLLRANASY